MKITKWLVPQELRNQWGELMALLIKRDEEMRQVVNANVDNGNSKSRAWMDL